MRDAPGGIGSQRTEGVALKLCPFDAGFLHFSLVSSRERGGVAAPKGQLYAGKVEKDDEARSAALSLLARGILTPGQAANLAGVSRQTVSNAVNNPDLLRADTLARVQQAIEQLGYLPKRAARNLRTRSSHLIGLRMAPVMEGTASAVADRFVHSLVESSREAGYHVLLFTGELDDPTAGYDDLLRSTAAEAFVVADT